MRKVIWTRAASDLLYETLVERFGAYKEWEKRTSPGRGLDDKYHEFCKVFAKTVGANSGDAVEHQIAFALPIPDGSVHTWDPGQARVAILNIASAFHAGFLSNTDFPASLSAAG
jgi:hypothetical protein